MANEVNKDGRVSKKNAHIGQDVQVHKYKGEGGCMYTPFLVLVNLC